MNLVFLPEDLNIIYIYSANSVWLDKSVKVKFRQLEAFFPEVYM